MGNYNVKQVLIWNKSLRNAKGEKVRTGKIAAQLAHASMAVLLNEGIRDQGEIGLPTLTIPMNKDMDEWVSGSFAKICVSVDSEQELLFVHSAAENAGLPCSLIQDAGLTEFDGVPTYTAVAIGPAQATEIDKITGLLKLL